MARSLLFGNFRIDLASRELWRGGELIPLPPKSLDVLAYLAEHAGEIVTRDQLFQTLWPEVFVADHALSVQILEIRKALGDTAQDPTYIETRPRRGYRFCAPVTVESAATPSVPPSIPRTRYADSRGVNIAYQVIGDGPVDLVFVMGWVSHLEYFWTEPRFARFLKRLSSFSRVILFDKRGTGMSDRVPLNQLPTIEQRMEDVHCVMDAIGSQQAVICGVSEGGCMSAVFAATYPERASALIMFGTYARRIWASDYPWAPTLEQRQAFFDTIRRDWGGPVGLEERAPSVASDPQFREWWAAYLRMGANPNAALALTAMNTETDIRNVLPLVRVPTLVMHRVGDRCLSVEEGRYIASRIPGAQMIELPGDDHVPFVGDQEAILTRIEEFIRNLPGSSQQSGVLSTILISRFDRTPEAHDRASIQSALLQCAPHESCFDETFITAAFHGPARAVQCARALHQHACERNLQLRSGLHTGELLIGRAGTPLGGPVVTVAEKVLARAGWNQILATGTLRDLVAGSGIAFSSIGRIEDPDLGEWQLLEVMPRVSAQTTH